MIRTININKPKIAQFLREVSEGDYLIKCNKSSDSRKRKFFVITDGQIRWANGPNSIKKAKKQDMYSLSDVVGI